MRREWKELDGGGVGKREGGRKGVGVGKGGFILAALRNKKERILRQVLYEHPQQTC